MPADVHGVHAQRARTRTSLPDMRTNTDVEAERSSAVRDAATAVLWPGPIRGFEGLDAVILGYD